MFLAFEEIRHAKWRYISIAAVVFLVSYLVYFLTGLAWGLASSYTEAIERWEASSVTLTQASNRNPLASRIPTEGLELPADSAALTIAVAAVEDRSPEAESDARLDTYIFAVDRDQFLSPQVSEGEALQGEYEVVADSKLKRAGYQVGDSISLPDAEEDFTIVGFSTATRFQTAPVLYIADEDKEAALGKGADQVVSVVVNRSDATASANSQVEVETVSTADFIDELPGYRAQYLTFSLMVVSMIAILSLVLGIFMYVLTLQKKAVFGIMKARGISTAYIARAGAYQTLLVSSAGVLVGMGAAVASAVALSEAVPFAVNWLLFGVVTAVFILFTLLGSLFPIRVIAQIDPVEAIA